MQLKAHIESGYHLFHCLCMPLKITPGGQKAISETAQDHICKMLDSSKSLVVSYDITAQLSKSGMSQKQSATTIIIFSYTSTLTICTACAFYYHWLKTNKLVNRDWNENDSTWTANSKLARKIQNDEPHRWVFWTRISMHNSNSHTVCEPKLACSNRQQIFLSHELSFLILYLHH